MEPIKRNRIHERRLREIYRSAGWPSLDVVEIELLAAGLLVRAVSNGHDIVRVTDAGIQYLANVAQRNRKAFNAHQALVDQISQTMQRDGRIVWTELSLRAWIAPETEGNKGKWKMCRPDVFSIRNSSKQEYLEPIVHEIKVSRADLLSDLRNTDKRKAYLDIGGQCWYVLGADSKGRAIGEPEEIPAEYGILFCKDDRTEVLRVAQKRISKQLPFSVWMALAKATPQNQMDMQLESSQSLL